MHVLISLRCFSRLQKVMMLIAHICPVLHSAVHAAPRAESYGGDDCMTDWKSTCVISQCMAHAAPSRQCYSFFHVSLPLLSMWMMLTRKNKHDFCLRLVLYP